MTENDNSYGFHVVDHGEKMRASVDEWEALVIETKEIEEHLKKVEYLIKNLLFELPPEGK